MDNKEDQIEQMKDMLTKEQQGKIKILKLELENAYDAKINTITKQMTQVCEEKLVNQMTELSSKHNTTQSEAVTAL